MNKRLYPVLLFVFVILTDLSCSVKKPHEQHEIEQAMVHYDSLLKKMDADSIALLFTPDGELSPKYHGRDSIRLFLSSFKDVKLLTIATTSDSVEIKEDTAVQDGHYAQSAVVNGKDTIYVEGTYHARWIWTTAEGWKIRLMSTRADNFHHN